MSCREKYLRLCEVTQGELDKPCTEVSLRFLALTISDWERLAPFLDITGPEVVAIRRNSSNSYQQQTVKLLLQWQQKVGTMNATYRKIFTTLDEHTTEQLTWDGTELDQPLNDIELAQLANTLEKWEDLAPQLSITAAEREEIRRDSQNYWNQKFNMLQRWRQKVGEKATRRNIVKALRIANKRTADSILSFPAQNVNLVDDFREHLRHYYQCQLPPSATQYPPQSDSIYIPPTLILEPSNLVNQQAANDSSKITGLSEVLVSSSSRQQRSGQTIVLLKGSAGSGKSTAIWCATHEWAEGTSFADFDLMFAISLDSPTVRSASSLEELIPHPDKQVQREVAQHINQNGGEKFGFLIDGLDHFPPKERLGEAYVVRLLKGDPQVSLPKASILVASRPEGVTSNLKITWSTTVLLKGFSMEQSRAYFESAGIGGQSLDMIVASNPALYSLVSLPLNAAILNYLLECQPTQSLPSTRTEFYDVFVTNTLLRNLRERFQASTIDELPDYYSLPEVVQETFWQLCKLAWQGMNQSQTVFSQRDITKAGINPDNLHILGLTNQSRYFTPKGMPLRYTFHHISIQEFLAALHLSLKCSEAEQIAACQQLIANMFVHVVKQNTSVVPPLDNPWNAVPTFFLLPFFIGLERQAKRTIVVEKVIRMLLSMYADRNVNKPDHISEAQWGARDLLTSVAPAHFPLTQCLYCVYEAQIPKLCHDVTSSLIQEGAKREVLLSIPRYVDQGITVCAGYYLAQCCSERSLEISFRASSGAFSDQGIALTIQQFKKTRSNLDTETQRMLTQSVNNTIILRFTDRGLTHEGIQTVCDSLDMFQPILVTGLGFLDGWAPNTDKIAALTTIVDALATHKYLESLDLTQCGLTEEHAQLLQRLLTQCNQLVDLSLPQNNLGDAVTSLAPHIGGHPSLTHLTLVDCRLTPAALRALGRHLAHNSTLERLYIGCNLFHASDIQVFLTAMKRNKALTGLWCELPIGLQWIVEEINIIREAEDLPELKLVSLAAYREFVGGMEEGSTAHLEHSVRAIKKKQLSPHATN